jgi:hypothetical protein
MERWLAIAVAVAITITRHGLQNTKQFSSSHQASTGFDGWTRHHVVWMSRDVNGRVGMVPEVAVSRCE